MLSRILRHGPGLVGIRLDRYGWANVNELIQGIQKKMDFSWKQIEELVW